jgi:hypothetical protein
MKNSKIIRVSDIMGEGYSESERSEYLGNVDRDINDFLASRKKQKEQKPPSKRRMVLLLPILK